MLFWWPVPVLLASLQVRDRDQLRTVQASRGGRLATKTAWAQELRGEKLVKVFVGSCS